MVLFCCKTVEVCNSMGLNEINNISTLYIQHFSLTSTLYTTTCASKNYVKLTSTKFFFFKTTSTKLKTTISVGK
jgi:hypothetical protein